MNHRDKVLAYLKQGKTITQGEAINLFNCYRLSAVIQRLRNTGYHIITHNEPNINARGSHARYELVEVAA